MGDNGSMSDTLWKWRLYLIIPAAAVTPTLRQQIANRFSANGSGESEANEDIGPKAIRLSTTGNAPAQAIALNTAVKASMRDALRALIEAVPSARVWVVANTAFDDKDDGELIATNTVHGTVGQVWTFEQAIAAFNLLVIIS